MSLKDTIEQWQAGVEKAEAGHYEEAIDCFTEMPEPGARIYFNIASMFLRLGNLEDAERVKKIIRIVRTEYNTTIYYRSLACLFSMV